MSYESKIQILRRELDQIDDELVSLLIKRFSITSEVGKLKTTYNIEITDNLREATILNKVKEKIENEANADRDQVLTYIVELYLEIMKLSKQQQFKE